MTNTLTKTLRVVKITAAILLILCLHVSAKTVSQTITLSGKDIPLTTVFSEIRKQSGYLVVYNNDLIVDLQPVTLNAEKEPLLEFLDSTLINRGLSYVIENKTIILKKKETTLLGKLLERFTPPIDIIARVTDEEGNPLEGATVKVKGTNKIAVTNADGSFKLTNVDANVQLEISFVGFETTTISAKNTAIKLKRNTSILDEVQYIAYGTQTKRFSVGNVTTIKAADIEKQPVQNPLLALQGRVPGLEVTQLSGMNGGGLKVRIQGRNSINSGLEPLIVIDGVPYPTELKGTNLEDIVQGGSPLNYINPTDIESIDVLKDADATSIYGSRAANGAILITTKKGKIGRTKLNINFQQGWGKITRRANMMNTRQYLDMRYEAYKNDGINFTDPNQVYAPDLTFWDTTRYTDWQKELIGGTAKYTNIGASMSGGNAGIQYMVGGTFNRQTTVFPGDFENKSGGLHFSINGASANQKFKMQFTGNYTANNNKLPNVDLTGNAIGLEPNAPALYNPDGSLNWAPNATGASTWQNPLVYTLSQDFNNDTKNLVANAKLGYTILPGLEFISSFGYTNMQSNLYLPTRLEVNPPEYRSFSERAASYGIRNMNSWIIEPRFLYKKSMGKGRLDGLLGSTLLQNSFNVLNLFGSGFSNDLVMKSIASAKTQTVVFYSLGMYKYNALFGRLNYVWDDKYIINLTGRRDGSSRFGDNNKLHDFWSLGTGWVFSEENLIRKRLPFLSFGKIRASYGTTGNDQIADYSYLSIYTNTSAQILYQGSVGFSPSGIPNPYLQWEETRKLQGGIDVGILRDRIVINATYALNRSSNQLIAYRIPSITGFTQITKNFPATVQNTSWEFSLNTTNIKGRNFTWNSSINITIPRNKLLSFSNIEKTSYGAPGTTTIVGQPLGLIRTLHFVGIDPASGLYQVADKEGKPVPVTAYPNYPADWSILISTLPAVYGGIQNSISFKGFQIDFLLQCVRQKGPRQLYFNNIVFPGQFGYGFGNQPASLMDRWQKPGDITSHSRFNSDGSLILWPQSSDVSYNYDASYLRLKNVSLSWQLPTIWLKNSGIQSTRLNFQGQNLVTITKFSGLDPESQGTGSLPPLQMWTVGLQMEF
jgi:TonB-linked SusC/RagA family outer membrane protein